MDDARELVEAGRLDEAISTLGQALKAKPTDQGLRTWLFELLCFSGDLDRAARQLEVLGGTGDPGTDMAVQVYRDLVGAERARRAVFQGDGLPKFLVEPPPHVERHLVALKRMVMGAPDAAELLAEAEEQAPAISGQARDVTFTSFRDADDRVGPILEVFLGPDYVWVPFSVIERLQVSEPRRLRDLMWAHARIEAYGQQPGDIFIPALYPDSHLQANAQVKLGRVTEWRESPPGVVVASGQRVFMGDGNEFPLFELRDLRLSPDSGGVTPA